MESYEGGRQNSMADNLGNEGRNNSSMAENEGGSKNPRADSLGIEGGSKSPIDSFGIEGESKSSMVDSLGKGGGGRSSITDTIENEGGPKSSMDDSIENEGENKSSVANIIENEGGNKSLEKNSWTICLSLGGPCTYHSAERNKPLSVYSSVCEDVGKQRQQRHTEGRQTGTISMRVDENQEAQLLKQDTTPEHCFLGSSVCYGGPDEYYYSLNGRKEEMNKIKREVRKLEDAANPSNLEYTIRGNWWKGSLDY